MGGGLLQPQLTLIDYNSQSVQANATKLSDFSHMPVVVILRPILARCIFGVMCQRNLEVGSTPAKPRKSSFQAKKGPKNHFLSFLTLQRWITLSNATFFIKQTFFQDEVENLKKKIGYLRSENFPRFVKFVKSTFFYLESCGKCL